MIIKDDVQSMYVIKGTVTHISKELTSLQGRYTKKFVWLPLDIQDQFEVYMSYNNWVENYAIEYVYLHTDFKEASKIIKKRVFDPAFDQLKISDMKVIKRTESHKTEEEVMNFDPEEMEALLTPKKV